MRKQNKIFYTVLISSVFIHLAFFGYKLEISTASAPKSETRVKLRFKKDTEIDSKKQIVQSNQNKQEEKIKDSEFFSEHNNKFDKQTKAKENGAFQNAGKGSKNEINKAVAAVMEEQKPSVKKVTKKKGDISFKDFSFTPTTPKVVEKIVKQKHVQQKKGVENGDILLSGAARTNDYLEHIPLGDMTNLNTSEHVYYGFYFRIKQQLEQHWGASLREKMEKVYKRNGRFPASDKYITSIKVMLDEKGKIVDIIVKGSSGVEELDQAAIESFNKAGPFPNPPKGMIINGRASIEWGFAVTNS